MQAPPAQPNQAYSRIRANRYNSTAIAVALPETRFPGSVDLALSWKEVSPDLMQKILWENAVKAFGEP